VTLFPKLRRRPRSVWLCAAALVFGASSAGASNPYLEIPSHGEALSSRAYGYANMSNEQAYAELRARGVPFEPAIPPLPGVRAPIRLRGPLRGVAVHSSLPVELVHYTMYRPSVDKVNQGASWQTRHPGGLAIDVGGFRKRSGRWLAVGPHWPSRIGARTCGQGARELRNRPARELVSIVCEAADLRLFHYMLTPHFDEHHSDHLHLEIKPGVKWFLVN
jgi:hypothetical protein